jgi:hypothetical protein
MKELEEPAPEICHDLTGYSAYGRNVQEGFINDASRTSLKLDHYPSCTEKRILISVIRSAH